MDELSISKTELARMIGVTRAAMTTLFAPETKQTRMLPGIHKALRLAVPPSPGFSTYNAESIEANFELLDETDKALVRGMIASLISKKKT